MYYPQQGRIFPGSLRDLERVFGKPRIAEEGQAVWDHHGVIAYLAAGLGIQSLEIVCKPSGDHGSTQEPFGQEVVVISRRLDCQSTPEQLAEAGLEQGRHGWFFLRVGNLWLTVIAERRQVKSFGISEIETSTEPVDGWSFPEDHRGLTYLARLDRLLEDGRSLDDVEAMELTMGAQPVSADFEALEELLFEARSYGKLQDGSSACDVAMCFLVLGKRAPELAVSTLKYQLSRAKPDVRACLFATMVGLGSFAEQPIRECSQDADVRVAAACKEVLDAIESVSGQESPGVP